MLSIKKKKKAKEKYLKNITFYQKKKKNIS